MRVGQPRVAGRGTGCHGWQAVGTGPGKNRVGAGGPGGGRGRGGSGRDATEAGQRGGGRRWGSRRMTRMSGRCCGAGRRGARGGVGAGAEGCGEAQTRGGQQPDARGRRKQCIDKRSPIRLRRGPEILSGTKWGRDDKGGAAASEYTRARKEVRVKGRLGS